MLPHPPRAQLEALIASGDVLKGRLDVFEHNPREGLVIVRSAGGAGDRGRSAGTLEGWADARGSAKVREVLYVFSKVRRRPRLDGDEHFFLLSASPAKIALACGGIMHQQAVYRDALLVTPRVC